MRKTPEKLVDESSTASFTERERSIPTNGTRDLNEMRHLMHLSSWSQSIPARKPSPLPVIQNHSVGRTNPCKSAYDRANKADYKDMLASCASMCSRVLCAILWPSISAGLSSISMNRSIPTVKYTFSPSANAFSAPCRRSTKSIRQVSSGSLQFTFDTQQSELVSTEL